MSKEKVNSPLLSLVWQLRQMRNEKRDYLMGRVLTFLESIIPNEKQLKAAKDIVKSIFYEKTYHYNIDELLTQFSKKYCPDLNDKEKYEYIIDPKEDVPKSQNYFTENK